MKQSTQLWLLILGTLAIAATAFFIFGTQQSFIADGGAGEVPTQYRSINWNGINVSLEAPWFGTLTPGDKPAGISHGAKFCNTNDPGVTLINDYVNSNGILILGSSLAGTSRPCSGNYISAQFTIPAGTLKVECLGETRAPSSGTAGQDSIASCNVDGQTLKVISSANNWQKYPYANNGSKLFEITVTKPTDIKLTLETQNDRRGSANAIAEISFAKTAVSPTTNTPSTTSPTETPSTGNTGGSSEDSTPSSSQENSHPAGGAVQKTNPLVYVIWGLLFLVGVVATIWFAQFMNRR